MFQERNNDSLYPFVGIISSLLIFIGGLLLANTYYSFLYLGFIILLFLMYRYFKATFISIICSIIFGSIYFGLCYLISNSLTASLAGVIRIVSLFLAMVPNMNVPLINVTRLLNQIKCKKSVSLGILISMSFLPLLKQEIVKIKQAMKTRGVSLSISTLYRAIILPFCVQLVHISDTLSLSIETRGFGIGNGVYKKIKISFKDIVFLVSIIVVFILLMVVNYGSN